MCVLRLPRKTLLTQQASCVAACSGQEVLSFSEALDHLGVLILKALLGGLYLATAVRDGRQSHCDLSAYCVGESCWGQVTTKGG